MTFIDTRHYYFEGEELVESRESEREELKEGAEGKDWVKLSDGNDSFTNEFSYLQHRFACFHSQGIVRHYPLLTKSDVALFLKYCCLKVHLG